MALEQHHGRGPMLDRLAVLAFLKDFHQQAFPAPSSYLFSLETSKELFQFHSCVDHFIENFARTRFQILETCLGLPADKRSTSFDMSPVEYHRIARGLYHMDLYGHLFHTEFSDQTPAFTPMEQATLFLQQLHEWELEELLCVRSYLVEKLTAFLNQFEDDCLEDFKKIEPYRTERNVDGRWDNDDFFFSNNTFPLGSIEWIESCLTRGLRKLKEMLSASTFSEKLNAIGETTTSDSTLSQAMSTIPTYPDAAKSGHLVQRWPEVPFVDYLESYNEAWMWVWKDVSMPPFNKNMWENSMMTGHRRWGYIMYDHQRLERWGVLTRNPREVAEACQRILEVKRNSMSVERRSREVEEAWDKAGLILPENRGANSFGWLSPENTDEDIVVPPNYGDE